VPAAEPVPAPAEPAKAVEPVVEPAAPAEEPKKRTRVKKTTEPASQPAAPEVQAEVAEPGEAAAAQPSGPAAGVFIIGTLYVDCLPLTKPFANAFPLINKAAEEVCADMHVPHFGLVDFAKGGPAVAAQLRASLSGQWIDALYLETRSAEGKAVLNVLTSVARDVVRGVF